MGIERDVEQIIEVLRNKYGSQISYIDGENTQVKVEHFFDFEGEQDIKSDVTMMVDELERQHRDINYDYYYKLIQEELFLAVLEYLNIR